MDLRSYLSILRDRWVLVVSFALLGTLITGAATLAISPTYEATSQIFVSVQTQDGSTQGLAQGSAYSQNQVAGFTDLATSPLVLEPVIQERGMDTTADALAGQVTAEARLNTSLIDIITVSGDPAEAAAISNAVAASMIVVLPELQRPLDAPVSPVRITQTREAVTPETQASPDALLNLGAGLIVGLMVGVGVAVLKTTLDTRVRTEGDLNAITDRAILGSVGFDSTTPADPLAIVSQPLSHRAEAVRRLRTNLQFINAPSKPRSIVVTSSLPGEGKSTTAANLALAMADAGVRVVLIDGDLRRPTLAKVLGVEGGVGLTTVLIGRAELQDVIQPYGETSLDIIAAGEIPPNPSELLGSRQMHTALTELEELYDMVIIDSAPLLPVTDGALLAKLADGALLVVGADSAHRQQVVDALGALAKVDARVLGLVLNRRSASKRDSYTYYEYRTHEEQRRVPRRRLSR